MRWLGLVLSLSLGLGLLVLAGPRFAAAIVAAPGDSILAAIEKKGRADERALTLLVASRRSALAFAESARHRSDLGLALMMQSHQTGDRALMLEAREELRASLRTAPVRSRVWTRLGYVELALHGAGVPVANALHMAFVTAPTDGPPFDDGYLLERLRLAVLARDYFSEADHALFERQLRLAWKVRREDTFLMTRALNAQQALEKAVKAETR